MEPIVSIVDDDAAVRDSWAQLLAMHGYRTHQFPDSRSFLESRESGLIGCILLDIRMPGMNGIELQNELRRCGHEEPVVFVTGYGDVRLAVEAMKAGAANFLQKPCGEIELIKAVRDAVDARSASDYGGREVEHRRREDARSTLARLTEREREILDYVGRGMSSKMIARRLGISVRTVDAHRANMMMKTDRHTQRRRVGPYRFRRTNPIEQFRSAAIAAPPSLSSQEYTLKHDIMRLIWSLRAKRNHAARFRTLFRRNRHGQSTIERRVAGAKCAFYAQDGAAIAFPALASTSERRR